MELMKEDGKEVGTPSNLVVKWRRRRGRTTFSSAKQWRLRVQKRREASASDAIERRPSWSPFQRRRKLEVVQAEARCL